MLYAVIMAGGSGTRFWPLSRESNPKQALKLTGKNTLIQETVDRILPLIKEKNIYIVTIETQKKLISSLLPNLPLENIIAEPFARNTAPALGLAAIHIKRRDREGVLVALPADHIVDNKKEFIRILKKGEQVARLHDRLVTLGMKPDYPETGYGYIQAGTPLKAGNIKGVNSIKKFTEKPDLKTAKRFTSRKDYFWNGGIFLWKADVILKEIEQHMPELSKGLNQIEKSFGKRGEKSGLRKIYGSFEKISIDNGIMEKTDKGAVIPCNMGWNDVGSWLALEKIGKKDKSGNSVIGKHIGLETSDCIIHSHDTMVATIGLKDIVIVSTPDALLICPKKETQKVKKLVELLKKQGMEKFTK